MAKWMEEMRLSFLLAHLGRSHYVLFRFIGIKNSKFK